MAGHQDVLALPRQPPQGFHELQAGLGIQPIEGLIQHQELGLVQQPLGQADPLAHSLGHGGKGKMGTVHHTHHGQGPCQGGLQLSPSQPRKPSHHPQPSVPPEPRRKTVPFGHHANTNQHSRIAIGRLPEDPNLPSRWGKQAA